jgi:lipoprotein signal peptidase
MMVPWLELVVALAAVVAADQLTKRHVLADPRFAGAGAPRALLGVRRVINRRGLIPLSQGWMAAAWIVCGALALFALTQGGIADNSLAVGGVGLTLGGITGNVIDLWWRRGIVDFLVLGPWTCNLADLAIAAGVMLTVWALL